MNSNAGDGMIKYHSTYKWFIIYRRTKKGRSLSWATYINGLFHYADTLAGIKQIIDKLINERINQID